MTHWKVSDSAAAATIQSLAPTDGVEHTPAADMLDTALAHERAIALFPDAEGVLIVRIERVEQAPEENSSQGSLAVEELAPGVTRWTDKDAVAYEATGLLG